MECLVFWSEAVTEYRFFQREVQAGPLGALWFVCLLCSWLSFLCAPSLGMGWWFCFLFFFFGFFLCFCVFFCFFFGFCFCFCLFFSILGDGSLLPFSFLWPFPAGPCNLGTLYVYLSISLYLSLFFSLVVVLSFGVSLFRLAWSLLASHYLDASARVCSFWVLYLSYTHSLSFLMRFRILSQRYCCALRLSSWSIVNCDKKIVVLLQTKTYWLTTHVFELLGFDNQMILFCVSEKSAAKQWQV